MLRGTMTTMTKMRTGMFGGALLAVGGCAQCSTCLSFIGCRPGLSGFEAAAPPTPETHCGTCYRPECSQKSANLPLVRLPISSALASLRALKRRVSRRALSKLSPLDDLALLSRFPPSTACPPPPSNRSLRFSHDRFISASTHQTLARASILLFHSMSLLYHVKLRSIPLSALLYRAPFGLLRSSPQCQTQLSAPLRIFSTPANPRVHSDDTPTKRQRPTSRKKSHPTRKKKSSRNPWKGLDVKRLPALPERILFEQQRRAIKHAFQSALEAPYLHIPSLRTLLYTTRTHSNRPDLNPPDNLFALLINRIVTHTQQNPAISFLGAGGADTACEAFFQCVQLFEQRPDVPMLLAVLDAAARDPVVERRAERALSVFRFLRAAQLAPTPRFVFECFRVCVAGLAVEAAAVLMDFALYHKFYGEGAVDGDIVPSVRDYYNGMMFAALLTGDLNTALTAHAEMLKQGIEPDDLTQSIMIAVCVRRGDERSALSLFESMKRRNCTIAGCGYAALIHSAGERRDVDKVLALVREYVGRSGCGDGGGVMFEGPMGLNSSRYDLEVSSRAAALSRGDPVFSAFAALRACTASEHACLLLKELKERVRFEPSRRILMVVMETCLRGGKLDLARELRMDMERDACLRTLPGLSMTAE